MYIHIIAIKKIHVNHIKYVKHIYTTKLTTDKR